MGAVFVIRGILIYIYAFYHNPPHLHVRSGDGEFTITLSDRAIEGDAKPRAVKIVNDFIDRNMDEIMRI
ncbi:MULTISPECIES: DUF4160 domain-containing protein [Prevotellaceae]|uniref:DUF4160 domain-containing protein n=1 Tax=Prevotellaceae TaxID=171552 RepID=UPI000407CDEE|nr:MULTISPECIES: DUF4160 domain-containing protein [Prevotellaceae]